MVEEYASTITNNVREVVLRPKGKSVVTSRWLYKIKHAADGNIEKFKARFVARGFSQIKGVDYDETFTPVARVIEEEVYVEQPQGFEAAYWVLVYLVNTRPDICFAVNTLSQFMVEPRKVHWVAAKHILRHVQENVDYVLDYRQGDGVRLASYTNSDWAGSAFDRKSTSGCCFVLGSAVVSWFSRKQNSVALSSSKAEYMAAS
eukprot:PITA_04344